MHRELRAILENLVKALYADEIVALENVEKFRGIVPHFRIKLARAIGKHEGKIRLARLLLANIFVLDQKKSGDDLVGLDVSDVGGLHSAFMLLGRGSSRRLGGGSRNRNRPQKFL